MTVARGQATPTDSEDHESGVYTCQNFRNVASMAIAFCHLHTGSESAVIIFQIKRTSTFMER